MTALSQDLSGSDRLAATCPDTADVVSRSASEPQRQPRPPGYFSNWRAITTRWIWLVPS